MYITLLIFLHAFLLVARAVGDEDDSPKDAVDDGEDDVEPQRLLVLSNGSDREGRKRQRHAQEQRTKHHSRRLQRHFVSVWKRQNKNMSNTDCS